MTTGPGTIDPLIGTKRKPLTATLQTRLVTTLTRMWRASGNDIRRVPSWTMRTGPAANGTKVVGT